MKWTDGEGHYRINSLEGDSYTCELSDVLFDPSLTIKEIFYNILRDKKVELLYSGGLDSEAILRSCMLNKLDVTAVTMRLLVNNCPINTHDLYYSEKFCRENHIKQRIVDLHVDKFFGNGDHLNYLVPYRIDEPHVATHLWLFEQCETFPVIGGDYSWPWRNEKIVSPHRLSYNSYNRFLFEKSISGVGNMLGHSLAANILFVKKHISLFQRFTHDTMINLQKQQVYEELGLGPLELRFRSYGWEIPALNKTEYKIDLLKRVGTVKSTVKWGKQMADALGGEPGTNSRFS